MNIKVFCAWLLLLLPSSVFATEHPVSEADLAAYKELNQVRNDALKESLQKDIQVQSAHIEAMEKQIDQQDKLLESFSSRISDLSIFLTVFGLVAGLLGYFTVRNRAQKEARSAAAEWMEKEGQKAIDSKIKELDSHISTQKEVTKAKLDNLYIHAAELITERQQEISSSQNPIDSVVQEQISQTNNDAISQLVEALKHKPEADYSFDDWNARAHNAYSKENPALAAEYWLQAARGGKGSGEQTAQSLFNAGVALGQLKRYDEAIAMYDEVVTRYGNAPEPMLRQIVSLALFNKGFVLGLENHNEKAIAIYDEVVTRYGNEPEIALREQVVKSLLNKGFALSLLNRNEDAITTYNGIVMRYGEAPEPVVRELVAKSLLNKGNALNVLNRDDETIAVYDELVTRYANAPEPVLRGQVAIALNNKGIRLGILNRNDEALNVYDQVIMNYANAPESQLREQVAIALINKGSKLGQLKRYEESIPVFNEVLLRFSSESEVLFRKLIAQALTNKGISLGKLKRYDEAIAVFDEILSRYRSESETELHERVAEALNSKGYSMLCRAKKNWNNEEVRLNDLHAATTLFSQSETDMSNKPIVWGNQAYTSFLLGQQDAAHTLLKKALQKGGEELYKVTLEDLEIFTSPPDSEFRTLLENLWAEVK